MPIDARLVSYIQGELAKGFSKDQVRLALTQSGYAAADVDSAFAQLSTDVAGASALAQSLAHSGASRAQAQAQLTQAGFTPSAASRAAASVYGSDAPSVTAGKGHALVFALAALLVGAGGMWLLLGGSHGSRDVAVDPATSVSLAPAEVIAQVLEVARSGGADAGVRACDDRLSGRDRDLCVLDVAILSDVQQVALCDRISDVSYGDACLMNFLNADPGEVCAKVRLAENRDTCEAIARLRPISAAA